jgi:hypothetical protein
VESGDVDIAGRGERRGTFVKCGKGLWEARRERGRTVCMTPLYASVEASLFADRSRSLARRQTALGSRTESTLVLPTGCERMKTQRAGLAGS